MLSGFSVAWLELPVFLSVGVWLPLTLHLSRLAHQRRSAGYAIGAGLSITMSLLGGHPQIAFYSLMAVVLYWAYLAATPDSQGQRHSILISVLLACLALAVGIALAAPQLLPMMDLASASHRGVQPPTPAGYAAYTRLAMPFRHLITLFVPDFFGNPSKGTYWGYNEYSEYCAYIGILPLLLIPFAFMRRKRGVEQSEVEGATDEDCGDSRQPVFFAVLGIFALLMALGTPVNALFYYCVPGFTKAGSPARILYLFVFSAAVLAAMGMDRLLRSKDADLRDNRATKWMFLSGVGTLVICILLFAVNAVRVGGQLSMVDLLQGCSQEIRMFAVFLLAGAGIPVLFLKGKISRQLCLMLVVGILSADLISFGIWCNATCTPAEAYAPTRLTDFLKKGAGFSRVMALNDKWSLRKIPEAVLPPNSATMYGLFDVSGYDSLYPRRYKALLDAAAGAESCPPENGNMVFARNPNSPVYNLLGVKYVISRTPMPGAKEIDDCYVRENPNAFPRAFVVHSVQSAQDATILDNIVKGKTDLRNTAFIADEDMPGLRNAHLAKSGDGPYGEKVVILRVTCNTVDLFVCTNSDGLLILTDQYFPGWTARIGGRTTPVIRADYDLRGVPIHRGGHIVRFRYEPTSYRVGLILALLALAAIATFCTLALTQHRHRSG